MVDTAATIAQSVQALSGNAGSAAVALLVADGASFIMGASLMLEGTLLQSWRLGADLAMEQ